MRIGLGTIAHEGRRCTEAVEHFRAGIATLERAGQRDAAVGDRAPAATLLNNWAFAEDACGGPAPLVQSLRNEAYAIAEAAGASHTRGVVAFALVFGGLDDPETPAVDLLGPAATAVARIEGLTANARGASERRVSMLSKALVGSALARARALGPVEMRPIERALDRAMGLAAAVEVSFGRMWVSLARAQAYAALGDWPSARMAYLDFTDDAALEWSTRVDADEQGDALRRRTRYFAKALADAVVADDADLALRLMDRSKDMGLFERFAWSATSARVALMAHVEGTGAEAALPALPSLAAVQAALGPDEALVHFDRHSDSESLVALAITRHTTRLVAAAAPDLDARVALYRRALAEGRAAGELSAELWRTLLGPVAQIVDDPAIRRLVLVPRGALHSLPWATLRGPRGWLLDTHALALAPSAAAWLRFRRSESTVQPRADIALVVGAGHFDAAAERERLGLAADAPLRIYDDAAALADAEPARVLHVKAHGEYVPNNPATSALVLRPRGRHSGRLTLAEIAESGLDAEVAVLQSCEASRTEEAPGDQADSFARAFLASGARAVIAPLWTLPVATSDAMTPRLHAGLRAGLPASEALRRAQQALARGDAGPEHTGPDRWGIYVLTGDGG